MKIKRFFAPSTSLLLLPLFVLVACGDDDKGSGGGGGVATCEASGTCAVGEACVDAASGFTCVACAAGTTSSGGGATTCVDVCANTTCEAHASCVAGACVDLLDGLAISAGSIDFDPAVTSYTVDVGLTVAEIVVTATAIDGATLTVNDVAAASGVASDSISLALGTTSVAIAVTLGDRAVTYTVDVERAADVALEAYAKASNAGTTDWFGCSMALSGDTLVVGAQYEDGDATSTAETPNDNVGNAGAAYVFVRDAGVWTQQAYLKPGNVDSIDLFGISVAIDGDTIVVGARGEDGDATSTLETPNNNLSGAGAAYVFVRSGAVWSPQAYLKASNAGEDDAFGFAVAIDGDTIGVSAIYEDGDAMSTAAAPNDAEEDVGAVYVFTRTDGLWEQQGYLKPSDAQTYDEFGAALDLDGDSIVVNAPNRRRAYVFVRNGTSWTQQASLEPSNSETSDVFGGSLAISGDTIVVGASGEDGDASSTAGASNNNAPMAGAAYVFVRVDAVWTQQAYLKASNADASDNFGDSVAIDGDIIVVGAPYENGDASSTASTPNEDGYGFGAAYVFVRDGAAWSQQAYLKASNGGVNDILGNKVAVSGGTVAAGALGEDGDAASTLEATNDNVSNAGAVYVFTL